MESIALTREVLNDLVQINNDRIIGYEKALEELKDGNDDLRAQFLNMIKESHGHKMALATEIEVLGADVDGGTTTSGKIYRAWMSVKSMFSGNSRHEILSSCEHGEDATQEAYETALEDKTLPAYLRTMVEEQKHTLKLAHDQIRALRDQAK